MIDTAAKRKSAAAVLLIFCPGVTPDATKPLAWRQQAGWGYSGIGTIPPIPTVPIAAVELIGIFNENVAVLGRLSGTIDLIGTMNDGVSLEGRL